MDSKLFDTLLEPIFIFNQDKVITYCNDPAALLCDLSPRKIMRSKLTLEKLFHFSEEIQGLKDLTQVTDPTPFQEVSFTIESGKVGKVQLTIQPFESSDSASPASSWIAFFRDVTLEETLQKKYRAELEQKEDVILELQKAQLELERYSKNLEIMVQERTQEIQKLNQLMGAMLDSLGEAFFVFDSSGDCLEVFSKACETIIETKPSGYKIWDVLKVSESKVPGFKQWMLTVFGEMLPFEDLAGLGPNQFSHSQGHHIRLEYHPLRGTASKMDGVVVVATDISKLVEAQAEAAKERAHAKMIVTLIQQKKQITSFLQETQSQLAELQQEFETVKTLDPENLFRNLHTLKGGAAVFSIQAMADQAHQAETLLTQWKLKPTKAHFEELKESALSIGTQFRNFMIQNESLLGSAEKRNQRWLELPAARLFQFQAQLPDSMKLPFVQDFLMEPIGDFFLQYQEMCRSIAENEMKRLAPISFHGSEIPVLPEAYLALFSSFIHAYRNSVDHGIEIPAERESSGKSELGKIETFFDLDTTGSQAWLKIEIRDDGGGVDPEKIRARLLAKGIPIAGKSDQEIIQHLFDSQFSTREKVTELSGRGVGLDAILAAAKNLGGKAWIESQLKKGTSLKVQVPYLTELPQKKTPRAA